MQENLSRFAGSKSISSDSFNNPNLPVSNYENSTYIPTGATPYVSTAQYFSSGSKAPVPKDAPADNLDDFLDQLGEGAVKALGMVKDYFKEDI